MPSHPKTTIVGQLNLARLALNNTQNDPTLSALVANFGYNQAKIDQGWQLYDAATAAVNAQAAAVGAQLQATAVAAAAEARARASYQALAQLARAMFPASSAQRATLGLVGIVPQSTPAFLAAAHTLFKNAVGIADIAAVLAEYGYDAARLADEYAVIGVFNQAYAAQAAAISAAQQISRDRRVALSAIRRWVAQYLKIAKIALREQPMLIEKLGGVARSSKSAAQRAAPKKAAATRAARQAEAVTPDA